MFRIFMVTLGVAASLLASTPKYTFPYQADYPHGIRVTNTNTDTIQSNFTTWKSTYYVGCPDSARARILWLDPTTATQFNGACDMWKGGCTVSEGIGYGMLITVYADNATNQTQSMFDKLWAFYQSKTDENGLMNWEVNGCDNGTVGTGAATDADLDVATALCMAYKQWGDSKYLTAAQTMLGKIWTKEVNTSSNLLMPDDHGTGNLYNPSYFATGAARVFAMADNNSAHQWAKLADASLAFMAKNQNGTTGLVSDWTDGNAKALDHNGSGSTKFGYDAVRTPWRMALDYLWFGTPAAKTNLDKIGSWIYSSTGGSPGNIRAEYNLDGTNNGSRNAIYTGSLLMSTISNSADAAWLNLGYSYLTVNKYSGADGNYFNKCWKVLYLLTLSGNFQNLWGTVNPPVSGLAGSRSSTSASWSASARPGTVELRGTGPVRAQLLDLSGRILSQASGSGSVALSRPAGHGVWLVRILGEHPQTIPVVAN